MPCNSDMRTAPEVLAELHEFVRERMREYPESPDLQRMDEDLRHAVEDFPRMGDRVTTATVEKQAMEKRLNHVEAIACTLAHMLALRTGGTFVGLHGEVENMRRKTGISYDELARWWHDHRLADARREAAEGTPLWRVLWVEHPFGRYDGYSLHRTFEDAKAYISRIEGEQPAWATEEWSRASRGPEPHEVSLEGMPPEHRERIEKNGFTFVDVR